jgi:putative tricarboxylic transport membrane protein
MLDFAGRRTRRWRIPFAAAAMMMTVATAPAAQTLDRLELIAPASPGGGWDQTARSMQEAMQSEGIIDRVEVENIPGAGGTIGLAQFVDSRAGQGDAMMISGLVMVGAILTNQAPVTLEQVTPIARLTGEYEVIVVPADSPHQSLQDLIDAFKEDPGSVSWGGGSAGGTDHILVGLIAQEIGADPSKINYIPFSGGGEALAAILGGHVTAGVSGLGEWVGQIQAGELRALAISSPERLPGVDIPTLIEGGVDLDLVNWRGVVAPPELDETEREALLGAVDTMAKSETWQGILENRNWMDTYLPGDEFAAFLEEERQRVEGVLRDIGLVQ